MTLREGPLRVDQLSSGRVSFWREGSAFGLYLEADDLPALRRLLEKLEGREKVESQRKLDKVFPACRICGKRTSHVGYHPPKKPAQPTKGKRRRSGGKR